MREVGDAWRFILEPGADPVLYRYTTPWLRLGHVLLDTDRGREEPTPARGEPPGTLTPRTQNHGHGPVMATQNPPASVTFGSSFQIVNRTYP